MKRLNIYLAGAMMHCKSFEEMNGWRVDITEALRNQNLFCDNPIVNLNIVNPCYFYHFDTPRHQSELEVMNYDLARVKESDLIIVILDGLNNSIGTAIEMYESYKRETPVIAYDPHNEYENIHPWLQCCITRVEKNKEDLTDYIKDFYFG